MTIETNTDIQKIINNPIFFERNRVKRVYLGGKLFHELYGDEPVDNHCPEEWVASAVKAMNFQSTDENEGLSVVRGTDLIFADLLTQYRSELLGSRESFDILVKFLDSAIRLPIQAHPDKALSRKFFDSDFGKAEMWIVIATREGACIHFGFKDRMTSEEFLSYVEQSETNKDIMSGLLNKVPVKKGDVFFIPAKMVHAIGSGCLILEIQEPTDFTIQPENWCGEYHLSEYEKYLGIDAKDAMECFDFNVFGPDAIALGKRTPRVVSDNGTVRTEMVVGPDDTDCFAVIRHNITSGSLGGLNAPSICVVTEGSGTVNCGGESTPVKRGDYFFLPYAAAENCTVSSEGGLELVECLPPGMLS